MRFLSRLGSGLERFFHDTFLCTSVLMEMILPPVSDWGHGLVVGFFHVLSLVLRVPGLYLSKKGCLFCSEEGC